jgi:hypothetical protein
MSVVIEKTYTRLPDEIASIDNTLKLADKVTVYEVTGPFKFDLVHDNTTNIKIFNYSHPISIVAKDNINAVINLGIEVPPKSSKILSVGTYTITNSNDDVTNTYKMIITYTEFNDCIYINGSRYPISVPSEWMTIQQMIALWYKSNY